MQEDVLSGLRRFVTFEKLELVQRFGSCCPPSLAFFFTAVLSVVVFVRSVLIFSKEDEEHCAMRKVKRDSLSSSFDNASVASKDSISKNGASQLFALFDAPREIGVGGGEAVERYKNAEHEEVTAARPPTQLSYRNVIERRKVVSIQ